jgi:hypothetical protein
VAYANFYLTGSAPVSNDTSIPGLQEEKTGIADQVCTLIHEKFYHCEFDKVSGALNTLLAKY